jgi:hypothetical protein
MVTLDIIFSCEMIHIYVNRNIFSLTLLTIKVFQSRRLFERCLAGGHGYNSTTKVYRVYGGMVPRICIP